MSTAFPAERAGHSKADEADRLVVNIMLVRLKPGRTAYPSIALKEANGYDVRAASNGEWVYWWNKEELIALELNSVTEYIKRVLHKRAAPVVRHVVSKRRV